MTLGLSANAYAGRLPTTSEGGGFQAISATIDYTRGTPVSASFLARCRHTNPAGSTNRP